MKPVTKARIWTRNQIIADGFPESSHDAVKSKNNVGICISGGGTVSISAGVGYLRALHQLGLTPKIRYLSGVSGGSWVGVPYTFLPPGKNIETLLGAQLLNNADPGALTQDLLTNLNPESLNYQVTKANAVVDALNLLVGKVPLSEAFSEALGEIFLTPNGLFDKNNKKYFTLNQTSLQALLDANSGLSEEQFYLAGTDRPFLIANCTMVYPISGFNIKFTVNDHFPYIHTHLTISPNTLRHFEYTSLYSGCYPAYKDVPPGGIDLGGGYVASTAFNTINARPESSDMVMVDQNQDKTIFKLCDIMGSSGAAPGAFVENFDPKFKDLLACFNYWPVMNPSQKAEFLSFADGGTIEDTGIVALLRRKVPRIIAFVTASSNFLTYSADPKKQAQSGTTGTLDPTSISTDIRQLFGKGNYSWFDSSWNFQVFKGEQFDDLVKGFEQKLNAGETVMYRDTYEIVPNTFFGLEGGDNVEILWVYNNQVAEWQEKLSHEVKKLIEFPFPNYHTFFPPDGGFKIVKQFMETAAGGIERGFEDFWDWLTRRKEKQDFDWVHISIIAMKAKYTALLSHLCFWNVMSNSDEFREMVE